MKLSTAEEPLLVYDGECPLCEGLTRLYVKLGWVSAERRIALQDVEPELLQSFFEAGIRNEMVVYEPTTRAILSGIDGIFRLWKDTWARPIVWLLDRPLLRQASTAAYRFIGYNRRFLSVPRPRAMRCACEPDEHAGYNVALIVLTLAAACLLPWVDSPLLLWRGLLVALLLTSALTVPREKRLRVLGHLALGLFYAGCLTTAIVTAAWIPGAEGLLLAAPLAALYVLLRLYAKRFRYLELTRPLLRSTVAAIVGSAALVPWMLRWLLEVGEVSTRS